MRGGRHPCWSRSQIGLCVHECANGSVCVCVCVCVLRGKLNHELNQSAVCF